MILTGAGLSAASGIPTFRGDNGFWKKEYDGETDPTRILTMAYFNENPSVTW
jgi:NAD-dependent SIR2 family protein deacetylase